MADFKLVTAGEDIRIWDINGYSLVKQYNPHGGSVNSVAWSQDNNFIASASSAGDKLVITGVKNNNTVEIAQGEDRTCVSFNSNSRYLLSGGKAGTIAVWDLKTHKLKKTYKDHKGPITSLTFNWNDTYIASGSELGDIIMYNVVTAQASAPMTTPKMQAIRQLQYSNFKKSLLGAVSDDGAVSLWDTNTRRLLHSFTDMHCSSATGLAFSPLNEILLMSVGLDKRIVCYDVVGKTAVKTMTAECALTSIDIHQDGATLAVGSNRGKVFIYDLRQKAQPVHTFQAHQSAISSLRFQSNTKALKNDSTSSTKSHRSSITKKPSLAGLNQNSSSNDNSPRSIMNGDTDMGRGLTDRTNLDEVISPYRETSVNKTSEFTDISSENRPDILGKSLNYSSKNMSYEGVFSPLNENNSSNMSRRTTMGTSLLLNSGSSPPHIHLENGHDDPPIINTELETKSFSRNASLQNVRSVPQSPLEDQASGSSGSPSPNIKTKRSASLGSIKKEIFDRVIERVKNPPNVPPVRKLSEGSRPHSRSTSRGAQLPVPLTPPISENDRGDEAANGHMPLEASAMPVTPQNFQTEFIRNMIEDALEDFQDRMRKDVFNLQVEMLRQFQIQQGYMMAVMQQNSINPDLLAEVERLREEVKRLKKNF
ncbi:protein NEDD1-like isoform X2 [Lineus longissimus]|uniref:protein NEDD1-like isoform X2 n=1 Tax=Lineus longissimus TaxID=88925 RepID=UPI00315CF4D0